ncbi:MAG: PEP-CTERM sorting domain-containing protein [Verrucomicrobiaceae bacterium]|nr:PEP-CTERM sorting domain-containing protein [Verrucomicrobiaceae bacterium]
MYTTSSGQALAFGSTVRVGYFNLSDSAVLSTLQTSNNFLEVNALFKPLAEGIADAGQVSQAGNSSQTLFINDIGSTGHIFGAITNAQDDYIPEDARLSVWVFNDSSPEKATEWGIFSAASGWEYPPSLGTASVSTMAIQSESEAIRGRYDSGTQQLQLAQISVVPEPSSLLLLTGTLALVTRRRRKES